MELWHPLIALIGWFIIYKMANRTATRAEVRELLNRHNQLTQDLQKQHEQIWLKSNLSIREAEDNFASTISLIEMCSLGVNRRANFTLSNSEQLANLRQLSTKDYPPSSTSTRAINQRVIQFRENCFDIIEFSEKKFVNKYY